MQRMKRYFPVLVLCICMLLAVLVCLNRQISDQLLSNVHFRDKVTGNEIKLFYDDAQNKYYLFLPTYASPENVEVTFSPGKGQAEFATEDDLHGALPLAQDISLFVRYLWYSKQVTVQFWQCGGIPTLYIQSQPEVLSYLHESKKNKSNVTATLYDEFGSVMLDSVAEMSGRGNTTWDYQAKRPYELKLGAGASFGCFDNVRSLCLLAEYADESKLHNAIGYYTAGVQNVTYASGYQHVNLYVNGEYLGLYGIATKEEYEKHIRSDGIQGVFEIATNTGDLDFQPKLTKNPVRVWYGAVDPVQKAVATLEEALCSGNWDACQKIIDVPSFARKYLLEEVQGNSDLTNASQYFYLDGSGKIGCMLPWDYDLSLGYTSRYFNNKQVYEVEAYRDNDGWNALLLNYPDFRKQVLKTLRSDYDAAFVSGLEIYMKTTAEEISGSWQCDILRWCNARPYTSLDRSCGEDTLDGMVSLYADYFSQRIAFLEAYLANWEESCRIEFQGDQYSNLCIPRGADLWEYLTDANILRGERINPSFQGWYTEDGIPVEDIEIVTENIVFFPQYYTQEGERQE